jgi:hypothetical protein
MQRKCATRFAVYKFNLGWDSERPFGVIGIPGWRFECPDNLD